MFRPEDSEDSFALSPLPFPVDSLRFFVTLPSRILVFFKEGRGRLMKLPLTTLKISRSSSTIFLCFCFFYWLCSVFSYSQKFVNWKKKQKRQTTNKLVTLRIRLKTQDSMLRIESSTRLMIRWLRKDWPDQMADCLSASGGESWRCRETWS